MKKQITMSLIIILLYLLISSLTVMAQVRPDFSGTWKLNKDNSDFGKVGRPDSLTEGFAVLVITHNEPSFHWAIIANDEIKGGVSFTTDGKKTISHAGNIERTDEARWEGTTLLHSTKVRGENGKLLSHQERLMLSEDGKTLTILRHLSTEIFEVDVKLVYERQ
ncbi:MAG TPA: hypothetical protein VF131_01945 [Blastocatellia bacterium]|nr:hypothetical protein [Blastocatellia bacterium]